MRSSCGTWPAGRNFTTFSGATDTPRGVAFSPDGRTLATGLLDGIVKLWDVASGQELRSLSGQTKAVFGLAFSPDGKTLASGGDNIKLWDVASGQEIGSLNVTDVYRLAFSPDGKLILSGSVYGTVRLWGLSP
jgi:WD40 repeat protein